MPDSKIKFFIDYSHSSGVLPVSKFAPWVEKLGFDGITIGGSGVAGAGDDPMVILAQAAAVTDHLLLNTSIFLLPYVHPVTLAEQTATLDQQSQGRLIFGVGVGGERPRQFQILGIPLEERAVRTDEALEIIKGIWTQPVFSYHGRIFQFDNVSLASRPAQKPHPPIWIGGRLGGIQLGLDGSQRFKSRTAAMLRAAKYGDGWFPYLTEPETYRKSVDFIKAALKEHGRHNDPFTFAHNLFWSVGDDHKEALQWAAQNNSFGQHKVEFSEKYDIAGTPQECIKRVCDYVDAGVTHFACKPYFPADKVLDQVERIAKQVVPYFR